MCCRLCIHSRHFTKNIISIGQFLVSREEGEGPPFWENGCEYKVGIQNSIFREAFSRTFGQLQLALRIFNKLLVEHKEVVD